MKITVQRTRIMEETLEAPDGLTDAELKDWLDDNIQSDVATSNLVWSDVSCYKELGYERLVTWTNVDQEHLIN